MKTYIEFNKILINTRSFAYMLLASMLILLWSCGGSDDEPEVIENTFLKSYAGEKWETYDGIAAFKFNDDINNPFAFWWKNEADANCYYFFDPYNLEFEILEQTKDKLSVKFKYIYGDRYQIITWTFTADDKGIIHANNSPLAKTDKIHLRCE